LAPVHPIPFDIDGTIDSKYNFLIEAVKSLFANRKDSARLIFEIMVKNENGDFTHIAVYMPA